MIELVQTPVAILTLAFMVTSLLLFARSTPLGAASLPCLTLFIGLVGFFVMPVLALAGGDSGFFGLFLTSMACLLVVQLNKLGREARIAGCALVPVFFGFYAQSRGYFFKTLSDGLFLFGPLFLLHAGQAKRRLKGGT